MTTTWAHTKELPPKPHTDTHLEPRQQPHPVQPVCHCCPVASPLHAICCCCCLASPRCCCSCCCCWGGMRPSRAAATSSDWPKPYFGSIRCISLSVSLLLGGGRGCKGTQAGWRQPGRANGRLGEWQGCIESAALYTRLGTRGVSCDNLGLGRDAAGKTQVCAMTSHCVDLLLTDSHGMAWAQLSTPVKGQCAAQGTA